MQLFSRKNKANAAPRNDLKSPLPFSPFPSTSDTCAITRPDKAFFRTLNVGSRTTFSFSQRKKVGGVPHTPPPTTSLLSPSEKGSACALSPPHPTPLQEYSTLSPERRRGACARVSRMVTWLRRRQGSSAPHSPAASIARAESQAHCQESHEEGKKQGGTQHRRYDSGTCVLPPPPALPSPPAQTKPESCVPEDFLAWTVFPLALPPHAQQSFVCVVCAERVAPTWYDASSCLLWKVMGCKPGCGIMHEGCLVKVIGESDEETEGKGCETCRAFMRVVKGMDERDFGESVRSLRMGRGMRM